MIFLDPKVVERRHLGGSVVRVPRVLEGGEVSISHPDENLTEELAARRMD